YNQTGYLEGYLNTVVHSTYMDMLANAGYGVGRGSWDGGKISLVNIDKTKWLYDSDVRSALQSDIYYNVLQKPNGNSLYVFFVEPDVAVKDGSGGTSQKDFRGYHGAFWAQVGPGSYATVRYAVMAYPGGIYGNLGVPGLSALDSITKTAGHEIAEAATDPDI